MSKKFVGGIDLSDSVAEFNGRFDGYQLGFVLYVKDGDKWKYKSITRAETPFDDEYFCPSGNISLVDTVSCNQEEARFAVVCISNDQGQYASFDRELEKHPVIAGRTILEYAESVDSVMYFV